MSIQENLRCIADELREDNFDGECTTLQADAMADALDAIASDLDQIHMDFEEEMAEIRRKTTVAK